MPIRLTVRNNEKQGFTLQYSSIASIDLKQKIWINDSNHDIPQALWKLIITVMLPLKYCTESRNVTNLICISTLKLWTKCPEKVRQSTGVNTALIHPARTDNTSSAVLHYSRIYYLCVGLNEPFKMVKFLHFMCIIITSKVLPF